MRRQLAPALRMVVVLTIITGLAYPLAVTGFAQSLFGDKANGSLVEVDGRAVGSSLLGQTFTSEQYFHGRPSAAGSLASGTTDGEGNPPDPEDLSLANSGGSNLGPTNETFLYGAVDDPATPDEDESFAGVEQLAAAYRAVNGLATDAAVPVDAVTSSASGLDPHISIANARLQAPRVAATRNVSPDAVLALIDDHTDGRLLELFGEPGVNVLELNLAVDRLAADRS